MLVFFFILIQKVWILVFKSKKELDKKIVYNDVLSVKILSIFAVVNGWFVTLLMTSTVRVTCSLCIPTGSVFGI